MSEILEPNLKPFNFWDLSDEDPEDFKFGIPEFFAILVPNTGKIGSAGWWDGEELLWLIEYYHASGNDLVFYTLDADFSMDECSKEEWFSFVSQKTPDCLPWILFRLEELNLT